MEDSEYQNIYNQEDKYWWYRGLHQLVLKTIDKYLPKPKEDFSSVLDAGCGTGLMLIKLKQRKFKVTGVDISLLAKEFCLKRGLEENEVLHSSIEKLPFEGESFSAVISLDVLYHSRVENDLAAIQELFRIVKKGGIIILNLPAFQFLSSSHDLSIHTARRYTLSLLKKQLTDNINDSINDNINENSLQILKMSYRNFFLFPLVATYRLLQIILGHHQRPASNLKQTNPLLNFIFNAILSLENFLLINFNIYFPWGSSVFVVLKKRPQSKGQFKD